MLSQLLCDMFPSIYESNDGDVGSQELTDAEVEIVESELIEAVVEVRVCGGP